MASPQNFRSSFNGFNREDVVNYISYMSNKHEMELNQLRQEADSMRQELEQLRGMGDQTQLQQENQSLRRQLEELQQEKEELLGKNEALRHKFTQLLETRKAEQEQEQEQEQLPPAEPQQTVQNRDLKEPVRADPYDCTEELNAYRRAESTERRARERAARMYEQANGILADASKGLEQSGGNLLELSRQVQLDLEEFQQAIAASGQILSDTMTALAAVRPDEEA